jgi:hypothetical protein
MREGPRLVGPIRGAFHQGEKSLCEARRWNPLGLELCCHVMRMGHTSRASETKVVEWPGRLRRYETFVQRSWDDSLSRTLRPTQASARTCVSVPYNTTIILMEKIKEASN